MGVLPVSRSLQLVDAVTAMIAHVINQPIDDRSERRRLSPGCRSARIGETVSRAIIRKRQACEPGNRALSEVMDSGPELTRPRSIACSNLSRQPSHLPPDQSQTYPQV